MVLLDVAPVQAPRAAPSATPTEPLPQLEVALTQGVPVLRTRGEDLPHLAAGFRRPIAEARRLMALSAHLPVFRALRSEIGTAGFAEAHLALCAELQPVWVPAGELLFAGLKALRTPLLILCLLYTSPSPRDS